MLSDLFRRKPVDRIVRESEASRMENEHGGSLKRTLRAVDLTAFGIAALIGAGIFGTVGQAAAAGGPAVSLLFIFIALACGFTAFCYAEFASMIPIAGSAYTYAYASFGELIAWIIGWDLLLEYSIGNIAIAISWSDYFTGFLSGIGVQVPEYLTMDFLTAWRGYENVQGFLTAGQSLGQIFAEQPLLRDAYQAWTTAPVLAGIHLIADVPALFITLSTTALIYVGIKESRNANNLMVALKLVVVIAVIIIGFFYVEPRHWSPFMPHGLGGVLAGVAAVFWAFIGFDAISTTAEECENPQRDVPRGIFSALIICTILYVLIAFVLTGIVDSKELNVGDPLAHVFKDRLPWLSGVISFSAIFIIASVFLVFQLGQPRIWMSMSRDGLLPSIFSRIHPRFQTPSFSTIVTGLLVAIPALFLNLKEVIDLSSIGTLFAFSLVCGGILVLENSKRPPARPKFKTPYINGRFVVPLLYLAVIAVVYGYFKAEAWDPFFSLEPRVNAAGQREEGWELFRHKIPMVLFIIVATLLTVVTVIKRLSLIPVLGLLTCLYLMSQLGITNWMRFLLWLAAGSIIYVCYGRKHSKLRGFTAGPESLPPPG
ncbi:MAG TPA: amino acid permease [Verrucomicrobiae bacterium]|nr:amino acid permease [Verrucomicrobiae bacterium]